MTEEPILKEDPNRFVLFPIKHDDIWAFYKKSEEVFGRQKKLTWVQTFTIGKIS